MIGLIRLIRLNRLDLQSRGRLHSYVWMDGIGWMVIIGHRQSKSTLGANKTDMPFEIPKSCTDFFLMCIFISILEAR